MGSWFSRDQWVPLGDVRYTSVYPHFVNKVDEACRECKIEVPNHQQILYSRDSSCVGQCIWLKTPYHSYLIAVYGTITKPQPLSHNIVIDDCGWGRIETGYGSRCIIQTNYLYYTAKDLVEALKAHEAEKLNIVITGPVECRDKEIRTEFRKKSIIKGSNFEFLLGVRSASADK